MRALFGIEGYSRNRCIVMIYEKRPSTDWQSGGHEFDPRQLHHPTRSFRHLVLLRCHFPLIDSA